MPVSRHTGTAVLYSIFLCLASGVAQAGGNIDLENDETFIYDIRTDTGELSDGSWNDFTLDDACDGCWELYVDGDSYNSGDVFSLDPSGREITLGVYNHISGLQVSRRVYVPQEVNFVRHLNILTNPTGSDITVEVGYQTNLGSDSDTIIGATSSGDLVADPNDSWAVTAGDPDDPIVIHVWDGLGALDQVDSVSIPLGGEDDVDLTWDDVTVPAGETVIYMTLGSMATSPGSAVLSANALLNLTYDQILFELDGPTIAAIQNWAVQDSDEDGMPDFFENLYDGLNPEDGSDAATDLDGDGLTNLEEYQNGGNPTDRDTDDDGLEDGDELIAGTDLDDPDTDGDGIMDGGEVNSASDPLVPNPNFAGDVITLSSGEDAWDPRAVTDGAGNTHVVWTQDSRLITRGGGGGEFSYDGYEIYYSLLDAAGGVLIGPTRLTDNDTIDVRARIAVDSMNRAVVLWMQDTNTGIIARVDPANDDQNGDPADPSTLLGVPATAALVDGFGHSTLAIDGDDNIHMVGHNPCGSPLSYAKFDIDGVELIAETTLADDFGDCHANPDIAIDADGNAHIVYTHEPVVPGRGGADQHELNYLMVDGATGAKLIDNTVITAVDDFRSQHATVNIDDAGLLHVIYSSAVPVAEFRGGGCSYRDGEIYRMALDPSLDDQSGDAADPAVIRTVDETLLTEIDGRHSWYSWSDLVDGEIEITWNDGLTCRDGFRERGRVDTLRHMAIDTDGNVVAAASTLTEVATGGMGNRYTVLADGRPYWSEFIEAPPEVVTGRGGPTGPTGFDTIVTPTAGFPVTLETATETGTATLTTDSGRIVSAEALNVADLPVAAQADVPRNIDFIDGLFRIVIDTDAPGDTVELTLNVPTAADAGTVYFKWDAVNGWYIFPHTVGATANDVVLTLTDGGAGDADGVVNGQIVDPGGAGTNTNVAPAFTSMPVLGVLQDAAYSYPVAVSDGNAGDTLSITASTLPGWLTLMDNGDGTASLTGTPGLANVGANPVVLVATDNAAIPGMISQSFTVTVTASAVSTSVSGSGGGSGATTPWLLLLASGLLLMRNRRTQKGAQS